MKPAPASLRGVSPYLRIGRCIYCRCTKPPLTDEHIFPQGLAGQQYLIDASCEECRKITSKVEDKVLRGMIWGLRHDMGLRNKRRKKPTTIPAFGVNPLGQRFRRDLHPEAVPIKATLPVFHEEPGILAGRPPENVLRRASLIVLTSRGARIGPHDPGSLIEVGFQPYARMLAKIAHATAVQTLGLDGFRPFLPPVILGLDDTWPYLIGRGDETPPLPTVKSSWIQLFRDANGLLISRVQLIASDAPIYLVVTGRLTAGLVRPLP